MMSEPDDEGAWADDSIPVPDPPVGAMSVQMAVAPTPAHEAAVTAGVPVVGPPAGASPTADDHAPTSWSRRKRVVAAMAAACAVVAAVMVLGGGDDPASTDTSPSTTDAPDDTAEAPDDTLQRTSTTSQPPRPETSAPARPTSIALPPEVVAISKPTEVLMLATDGILHTLSLPSGAVRSVPVALESPDLFRGQGFVVAPDAAAMVAGTQLVIVPREGPSIVEIDTDGLNGGGVDVVDWEVADDGTTRFLAASYSNDGTTTLYEVGLDGSAVVDEDPVGINRSFSTLRTPDGRAYVNDAGGVYEVSAGGSAQRIDDGTLRAVSSSSLLIRQCTPELVCGDVLVDKATGGRRPIGDDILPDALQFNGFGLDLAPDGSAVTSIVDSPSGQDRVVIDLTTGDQIAVTNQSWSRGSVWAADSSGVFELPGDGAGVDFLDRASGQVVHLADELGEIAAIAIRTPEAELAPQAVVSTVPITFAKGGDPSVAGLVVTALSRGGNIIEIDVDGRTADIWTASGAIAVRRASLFGFGDRVAVATSDNPEGEPSGFVATPGQELPLPPGLFGPGPLLAGPSVSTVWSTTPVQSSTGIVGVELVLVDLDAGALATPERSIAVPGATLLGGDGRGGIVVQKGGDIYVATASGEVTDLVRLTSGELLAIGADTAYVRECDHSSMCVVLRVERATGQRTAVSSPPSLDAAFGIDTDDPPVALMGTTVSPGGDVVVVRMPVLRGDDSDPAASTSENTGSGETASVEPVWVAVDITTGQFIRLDDLNGDAPLVWNAEATAAATLIGGQLVVIDRVSAGVWAMDGVGSLSALAGALVVAGAD